MVITDGQAGALSAIKDQWPNTRIQRCLVHIKRNIRTLTTTNPKIPAHKALWALAKRLVTIENLNQADQWVGLLQAFHDQWGKWLNHKTYKNQVPPEQITNEELPILYNINVGHATPRCIIPFGVEAEVDAKKQVIRFKY